MGSLLSSFSLSLASLLVPATLPVAFLGVSGGVVRGTPVTLPELAAAMLGMLPLMSGGLFTTAAEGTADDCVAIDEAELDRAGEWGRWLVKDADVGGEGAANEVPDDRLGC